MRRLFQSIFTKFSNGFIVSLSRASVRGSARRAMENCFRFQNSAAFRAFFRRFRRFFRLFSPRHVEPRPAVLLSVRTPFDVP